MRGYTAGSFRRKECLFDLAGSITGCSALDQLIGSRLAVANFEFRFPLFRSFGLGFLPIGFPPIEGALFFDAGLAWNGRSSIVLNRNPQQNKDLVREPLKSWGFSIRGNLLGFIILRADYAKPLDRQNVRGFWTLSVGPTF